ncbi:hypothetical protein CPT_Madawaska_136 [Staphylococcus phage Madawaska]|nr:hypothetical protein CPT_Madawaska_136 [Staphylococcus phage Madawaska]
MNRILLGSISLVILSISIVSTKIIYDKIKYRDDDIDTSEDPFMKGPLFI